MTSSFLFSNASPRRPPWLKAWALTLATAAMVMSGGQTFAAEAIKVASIHDLTGGLNIYGIQEARAVQLAAKHLNEKGGVLGRPVEVVEYDAQSELAKYTQYANTALLRDKVVALFAGLTRAACN